MSRLAATANVARPHPSALTQTREARDSHCRPCDFGGIAQIGWAIVPRAVGRRHYSIPELRNYACYRDGKTSCIVVVAVVIYVKKDVAGMICATRVAEPEGRLEHGPADF